MSAHRLLKQLVNYAIYAPSSHNTQPWLFDIDSNRLHLIADRARQLPVVDPLGRELIISCGAALGHIVIAARHFGRMLKVEVLPASNDGSLLATMQLDKHVKPRAIDQAMFAAISQRRTVRGHFDNRPLSTALCKQCVALSKELWTVSL